MVQPDRSGVRGAHTFLENLAGLLLRDALDQLQRPSGCVGDRFDGIVAGIDEKLDIAFGQSREALSSKTRFSIRAK